MCCQLLTLVSSQRTSSSKAGCFRHAGFMSCSPYITKPTRQTTMAKSYGICSPWLGYEPWIFTHTDNWQLVRKTKLAIRATDRPGIDLDRKGGPPPWTWTWTRGNNCPARTNKQHYRCFSTDKKRLCQRQPINACLANGLQQL